MSLDDYCRAKDPETGFLCVLRPHAGGKHVSIDNRELHGDSPGKPVMWSDLGRVMASSSGGEGAPAAPGLAALVKQTAAAGRARYETENAPAGSNGGGHPIAVASGSVEDELMLQATADAAMVNARDKRPTKAYVAPRRNSHGVVTDKPRSIAADKALLADPMLSAAEAEKSGMLPKAPKYSGEECRVCHNFTMVRTGKCDTCQLCGATGGCS